MPKQPTRRRQTRPSGPYDLRPSNTNSIDHMAGYHSVPQQSPTTWDPVYETYPTGSMMSNMPNYAQSPYIPHVSMAPQPTPALAKPHSNGIAHQRYHHLQHNVSGQGWTDGEDQLLVEAKKKGLQWNAISEQYFTGKSGNACRKRHERILQRSRAEWPEDKLERLATTYMSMREQIWTRIADELGESRWERVENMVSPILIQITIRRLVASDTKPARFSSRDSKLSKPRLRLDIVDTPSTVAGIQAVGVRTSAFRVTTIGLLSRKNSTTVAWALVLAATE